MIHGCKVILHDGTEHRPSWANHGSRGFYIGPALKHYRCYNVLMVESHTCAHIVCGHTGK